MTTYQFDADLKAVLARLGELPALVEKKLCVGALKAAAKPLQMKAKSNAPKHDGELIKSIKITSTFSKKKGEVKILVRAGNKKAYYAHMVERGVKAHLIKGPVIFGGVVYQNIHHPGFTPRPFMRPAFDSTGQQVVDAYATYMRENLPAALAHNGIG